jgi:hypothetical protein
MDGGYALIYPNNTDSTTTATSPLSPQFGIYGLFLEYGKGVIQGPIVLYQTLIPVTINSLDCDFAYVGVGQTCIIVANTTLVDYVFIKVDFLSSGTVYNINTFNLDSNYTDYNIVSLKYGGYFSYIRDNINKYVYGYILDEYGSSFNWDLENPTKINAVGDILVLPNNTVVIPQPEIKPNWSLLTIGLHKFEEARGNVGDTENS